MSSTKFLITATIVFLSAGCIPKDLMPQLGGGETTVSGAAGSAGTSSGATRELTRCPRSYGTVALVEPETLINSETVDKAPDPRPMLNLIMSQSGCFQVLSRGHALTALEKERSLSSSGELEKDIEKGKLIAAQYLISPSIIFSDPNAGGSGAGGLLGALLPGVVGVIAGGLKFQKLEAQVILTLTNVETGVQEAVAEGRATKSDMGFSLGGGLGGGGVLGAAGGGAYKSTDMNKIVVAAFLDAYNKLVLQVSN